MRLEHLDQSPLLQSLGNHVIRELGQTHAQFGRMRHRFAIGKARVRRRDRRTLSSMPFETPLLILAARRHAEDDRPVMTE